jgi:superfamily II DNA or RNA helicase
VKEMKDRFNLNFFLHDGRSLRTALLNALHGRFADHEMLSIVSLQVLRSEEFLGMLEKLDEKRLDFLWSFIVVDEAHHCYLAPKNIRVIAG